MPFGGFARHSERMQFAGHFGGFLRIVPADCWRYNHTTPDSSASDSKTGGCEKSPGRNKWLPGSKRAWESFVFVVQLYEKINKQLKLQQAA